MFIARNHFYIKGEKIEKRGEATYRLENATVTTCDGEAPDWRLAGSELDVTVDGYGTMKHGRFLARDIPLLYVPYLIFPAKTTRQSGLLLPHLSYSRDKNGLDVELPFFWAISESVDATFFTALPGEARFQGRAGDPVLPKPGVIRDLLRRLSSTTASRSRKPSEASAATGRRIGTAGPIISTMKRPSPTGFTLRSDIRRVSDPWYFRDFSSFNYYLDHYSQTGEERFQRVSFRGDESLGSLDSTVRLGKDWSLIQPDGPGPLHR